MQASTEVKRQQTFSESEVIENGLIPGIKSRVTLFRLRGAKKLGYLNVCNKIYYTQQHLEDYLASCERTAKTKK